MAKVYYLTANGVESGPYSEALAQQIIASGNVKDSREEDTLDTHEERANELASFDDDTFDEGGQTTSALLPGFTKAYLEGKPWYSRAGSALGDVLSLPGRTLVGTGEALGTALGGGSASETAEEFMKGMGGRREETPVEDASSLVKNIARDPVTGATLFIPVAPAFRAGYGLASKAPGIVKGALGIGAAGGLMGGATVGTRVATADEYSTDEALFDMAANIVLMGGIIGAGAGAKATALKYVMSRYKVPAEEADVILTKIIMDIQAGAQDKYKGLLEKISSKLKGASRSLNESKPGQILSSMVTKPSKSTAWTPSGRAEQLEQDATAQIMDVNNPDVLAAAVNREARLAADPNSTLYKSKTLYLNDGYEAPLASRKDVLQPREGAVREDFGEPFTKKIYEEKPVEYQEQVGETPYVFEEKPVNFAMGPRGKNPAAKSPLVSDEPWEVTLAKLKEEEAKKVADRAIAEKAFADQVKDYLSDPTPDKWGALNDLSIVRTPDGKIDPSYHDIEHVRPFDATVDGVKVRVNPPKEMREVVAFEGFSNLFNEGNRSRPFGPKNPYEGELSLFAGPSPKARTAAAEHHAQLSYNEAFNKLKEMFPGMKDRELADVMYGVGERYTGNQVSIPPGMEGKFIDLIVNRTRESLNRPPPDGFMSTVDELLGELGLADEPEVSLMTGKGAESEDSVQDFIRNIKEKKYDQDQKGFRYAEDASRAGLSWEQALENAPDIHNKLNILESMWPRDNSPPVMSSAHKTPAKSPKARKSRSKQVEAVGDPYGEEPMFDAEAAREANRTRNLPVPVGQGIELGNEQYYAPRQYAKVAVKGGEPIYELRTKMEPGYREELTYGEPREYLRIGDDEANVPWEFAVSRRLDELTQAVTDGKLGIKEYKQYVNTLKDISEDLGAINQFAPSSNLRRVMNRIADVSERDPILGGYIADMIKQRGGAFESMARESGSPALKELLTELAASRAYRAGDKPWIPDIMGLGTLAEGAATKIAPKLVSRTLQSRPVQATLYQGAKKGLEGARKEKEEPLF